MNYLQLKVSTKLQTQLNEYKFYCVLHVSALVTSHHQGIEIRKDN